MTIMDMELLLPHPFLSNAISWSASIEVMHGLVLMCRSKYLAYMPITHHLSVTGTRSINVTTESSSGERWVSIEIAFNCDGK